MLDRRTCKREVGVRRRKVRERADVPRVARAREAWRAREDVPRALVESRIRDNDEKYVMP